MSPICYIHHGFWRYPHYSVATSWLVYDQILFFSGLIAMFDGYIGKLDPLELVGQTSIVSPVWFTQPFHGI